MKKRGRIPWICIILRIVNTNDFVLKHLALLFGMLFFRLYDITPPIPDPTLIHVNVHHTRHCKKARSAPFSRLFLSEYWHNAVNVAGYVGRGFLCFNTCRTFIWLNQESKGVSVIKRNFGSIFVCLTPITEFKLKFRSLPETLVVIKTGDFSFGSPWW